MVTANDIDALDLSHMREAIRAFPRHIEEAINLRGLERLPLRSSSVRAIVLTGLGGSAIGGDLLRCSVADELAVPFIVNRSYRLPAFVDRSTLVIVSSYSGNTEETIAAHREALRRQARVLAITSGGTTAALAERRGHPCILIPGGLQPRAALAYSFFPLLLVLSRNGVIASKTRAIRETITVLSAMAARLSDVSSPDNRALALAEAVHGTIPVIYSPSHLEAVNVRWRTQIQENAKQLAFGHVLPEMNHNELVGWKGLPHLLKTLSVVFLTDRETEPRVRHREFFTQDILRPYASGISVIESIGRSRLARTFSLVHLGDWFSFYLALLNGVDPTPVHVIDRLKEKLRTV